MNLNLKLGGLFIMAMGLLGGIIHGYAENMEPGQASDFSAVKYYTNSAQVMIRTSGTEATQVGDLFVIKQFKLESFALDGHLLWVATAPECLIDQMHDTANSASHLFFQSGDGKMHLDGDGFLWRQKESLLTISNHVHTVLNSGLSEALSPKRNSTTKSKP
jgi:mannose-6-phosphate isomerase-like protein (cupin superfamily)